MGALRRFLLISAYSITGLSPFGDLSELEFESINLLTTFTAGSSPSFTIVDHRTYIEKITENANFTIQDVLPPSFLLSLSYRPHDNTNIRLLSTSRASKLKTISSDSPGSNSGANSEFHNDAFSSLILSSGLMYLQPSLGMFYPYEASFETNQKHDITLVVSNGSMFTCVGNSFIANSPGLELWDSGVDMMSDPVTVNFSQHLHAANQLVSVERLLFVL